MSAKTLDGNKCSGSEKGRMLFKSTDIFLLKKVGYNFAIMYSTQGEGSKNANSVSQILRKGLGYGTVRDGKS